MNCPLCGGNADILLNIINCSTFACRYFDKNYALTSNNNTNPLFKHHTRKHNFLGTFTSNKVSFDLYCFKNVQGINMCLARFKDATNKTLDVGCYYVDEYMKEIGTVGAGATKVASLEVQAALKESLRRLKQQSPSNPQQRTP